METITWNQQVVKKNNKALVFQLIIQNEPTSRADIAQISGFHKATVSSLVNELLLRKINNIPMTNILIDELSASTGLETRLESFVDIIKERRDEDEPK